MAVRKPSRITKDFLGGIEKGPSMKAMARGKLGTTSMKYHRK